MLHTLRKASLFRLALLCALLSSFAFALVLAASPELHERLHHHHHHDDDAAVLSELHERLHHHHHHDEDGDRDDDHGDHECLATALLAGGCDTTAPAPTLASFVATLLEITPLDQSVAAESLFLSFRILEHAPPRRA